MKITIIAAAMPPQMDGIGDYTAHLAGELAKAHGVAVLTSRARAHTAIPGVAILPAFDPGQPTSCCQLLPPIRAAQPDWLLLQYNPFAYGKWGRNPHLPRVMALVKRQNPQTRLAVMVHEPFVPLNSLKFAVMATWQRRQLWQLGRAADALFFSIDPWAQRFRRWFPHTPVYHLPVGSNIARADITRAQARQRLNIPDTTVALGLFGTAHASRLLDHAARAAQAVCRSGREALVMYMGPDSAAVRAALKGVSLLAEGPLEPVEVSRRFAALDVYLAPFIDGVSTRRTSLMTALQHGIATVGTRGHLTDACLLEHDGRAFLLAEAQDAYAYAGHVASLASDAPRRQALGLEAQNLYEREYAWPVIAQSLCAHLEKNGCAKAAGK